MLNKINMLIENKLSTMMLHQHFNKFKACNIDKEVVIVATGPTANKYKVKPDAIHIGVNRAFQLDKDISFDYYFIQDYSGKTKEYIDDLDNYRTGKCCTKFYGLTNEWIHNPERTIPESHAIKANALRYRTDWIDIPNYKPRFAYDISTQALGCFGSIVFPALQFALWTYPDKIYLVGCDCNTNGYAYNNEKNELYPDRLIPAYKQFKAFAKKYYPDVKIVCINPVGLKGIFDEEIN